MGCDIHVFSEVKKTINGIETWVNCDDWRYNPYYNSEDPDGESKMEINPIYRGRNYDLFAVLADVRNYGDTKYICQPKGLPEDVSQIIKNESDRWSSDGHSHSWFTLKELKDFQKENFKIKHSGLISQEAAKKLDEGEETPNTWCQWATPELNLVHREWEEEYDVLNPLIIAMDERMRDEFWIFRDDVDTTEYENKIRIVFWFDN
jgi:hypothetical protein